MSDQAAIQRLRDEVERCDRTFTRLALHSERLESLTTLILGQQMGLEKAIKILGGDDADE